MPVFISHSFEDKPHFQNVADALDIANVAYWNPEDVKSGASLRDQLREAVEQCSVCIFVASINAVKSNWCGAELGAFWGSGKPIIVYLAENSLADDQLPPLVQGDVWERRIMRVVSRAKDLADAAAAGGDGGTKLPSAHVGNMTIDQLERVIQGAVALAAASAKSEPGGNAFEHVGEAAKGGAARVLEGIKTTERGSPRAQDDWHRKILWVDDRPDNNIYERQTFESMGISFTLATSTDVALGELSKQRFAAIISDMGRKEGPREGYVLLDEVRKKDKLTPYFIYAGSNAPEHKRAAVARGAQGCTNRPQELVDMVIQALPGRDATE